jgi:hypothetical protein
MKDLNAPLFDIVVEYDDETGFLKNSFVQVPAVGVEKMAFSKQDKIRMVFADEKRKNYFMSVSILADTPILRKTKDGREFYVRFTSETIRKITNKMVMSGVQNEVTLQHDDSKKLDDVYLVEQFLSEKGRVYSPLFDIPEGSLVQTYWVKDDELYEKLLNDENFNGFSIEISANLEEVFSAVINEEKIQDDIRAIVFNKMLSDDQKEAQIRKILQLR